MRICDNCGNSMHEGFVVDGGIKYFCSETCLHTVYTEEEWAELYDEGNSDSYWTEWEESDFNSVVEQNIYHSVKAVFPKATLVAYKQYPNDAHLYSVLVNKNTDFNEWVAWIYNSDFDSLNIGKYATEEYCREIFMERVKPR